MAEEQETGGTPAGVEKKNKAILFIIISMVVVFLLLIGILVAVIMLSGGSHNETQKVVTQEAQQTQQSQNTKVVVGNSVSARATDYGKIGPIFPIADEFRVNLLTQTGKKVLLTKISLELDKPETQPEVETKLPVLSDAIIEILSSKSLEEVATVKGKNRVKDEIVQRLNEFLIDGSIKNVFFTSFLIG